MHRRRGRKVHFLRCLRAYNVWAQSNTHWRTCAIVCVRFTSLLAKNRDFRSVQFATFVRCPIRKNACIWSFGCTGGAVEKYIFFDVYALTMFGRKVTHIGERAQLFVCGLRHFWRKIVTFAPCNLPHSSGVPYQKKCVHLEFWVHRRRGRKVHFLRCLRAYNVWAQSNTHWRTCAIVCVRFTSLLAKNRDFRSVQFATIARCPISEKMRAFGVLGAQEAR